METVSVSCSKCGAPLEVVAATRFLTCNYCGSRLELHQTGSATYTAVLETIQEQTSQMAQDLGVIRLQNELEQLDRQWALEREAYVTRHEDGSQTEPVGGGAGTVVGCLFVGFFVTVCVVIGFSAIDFASRWRGPGGPGVLALVPFGMAILAIVAFVASMVSRSQKASQYTDKKHLYEEQRAAILAQLHQRTQETR